ncbi:RdgB/HAM1 family non-canonical purine NTP pyrophosphatase [Candidatus Margulisiibacteriota bacterium]
MLKLILSSNNKYKIEEIKAIMVDMQIKVCGYQEVFESKIDVIEDGHTFEENAKKKVLAFPEKKDAIYLGDDSGLEVDVLAGAPGIHSARYAGGDVSPSALCQKLLQAMKGQVNRKAQFRCVMAIRFPDQRIAVVEGLVKGIITNNMRGNYGFGYDPVFIPAGYDKTFAEINSEEKNQISHRYLALQKVKYEIKKYLSK